MLTPGKIAATVAVALTVPAAAVAWGVVDRLYPRVMRAAERLGRLLEDARQEI